MKKHEIAKVEEDTIVREEQSEKIYISKEFLYVRYLLHIITKII
jgi:hypothetical protein